MEKDTAYLLAYLILPEVLIADAISTFVGLNLPLGLIEANPLIIVLYRVGLWVVGAFHSLSVAASLGYALLIFYISLRSKLPVWSRRVIAASYFTSAGLLLAVPLHNILIIYGPMILGRAEFWGYEYLLSSGLPIGLALILTIYLDYIAVNID